MSARNTSRVSGPSYMLVAALAFSLMTLFVKLGGQRLPWQELVVARSAFSLVVSYAWLRGAGIPPLGNHRRLLLLRGVFGFAALSSVYYAVTHLPLAEATVIQFLYPPLTACLAAVALGERLGRPALGAMALGLAGLLLIAQPEVLFGAAPVALDPLGLLAAFFGAVFSACAFVTTRRLGQTEHPLVIVLYFPLVALPAALPTMIPRAVWPEGLEWLWLLLIGAFAQLAQVAMTRGLASDAAGRMVVYTYVQVLFAAVWGALFFGELPGVTSVFGAGLIVSGAVLNLRAGRPRAQPRTA